MLRKNRYLPINIFLFWWIFWLVIHNTSFSPIYTASIKVQFYFILMMSMVFLGYLYAFGFAKTKKKDESTDSNTIQYQITKIGKTFITILILIIIVTILFIGKESEAFSMSPLKYFFHIRSASGLGSILTDNKYLNILVSLFFFPLMFSLWILFLVMPKEKYTNRLKIILFIILVLFSYVYQVNYPIVMMMISFLLVIIVFERNIYGNLSKSKKKKFFGYIVLFSSLLLYAAVNRFGYFDILGIIKRYVVSYNTLGFYFFDVKLHDSNSVLIASPSFGRSFLGWFDSVFDLFIRFIKEDLYIAANLENVNDNMRLVVVGEYNGRLMEANAFGTILYTMYRDFRIVGIILYSFLYGIFLAYSYSRSLLIKWKAIFIILLFSGIQSIYQSSVEKPFFWFSIIFIIFISTFFIKNVTIKDAI